MTSLKSYADCNAPLQKYPGGSVVPRTLLNDGVSERIRQDLRMHLKDIRKAAKYHFEGISSK